MQQHESMFRFCSQVSLRSLHSKYKDQFAKVQKNTSSAHDSKWILFLWYWCRGSANFLLQTSRLIPVTFSLSFWITWVYVGLASPSVKPPS